MESVIVKRYSLAFKQSIVREYEKGASLTFLQKKYGIASRTTIERWVEKFGRFGTRHKLMVIQQPEEQNKFTEMETRIAELEHALAQAELDRLMLTACLEVAEKDFGVDVKKTREVVLSRRRKKGRGKRR